MNEDEQGQRKSRRKRRSDSGTIRLGERDERCLDWVGEQAAARLDQLQKLLGRETQGSTAEGEHRAGLPLLTESATRKIIARWRRAGLVEYEKIRMSEPGWVWLSRRGLEQLGLAYKYNQPALSHLAHLYAINQVRLLLEANQPEAAKSWKSERRLRYAGQTRTFWNEGHLADAETRLGGKRVALEVELTPKSRERLAGILREVTGEYGIVWYCCSPEALKAVQAAVSKLSAQDQERVQVESLEEISQFLTQRYQCENGS